MAADAAALAALLLARGKLDEAERLLRRAIATFRRLYGPVHHELAVNFGNLAALEQARGHAKAAERLYARAGPPRRRPDVAQPGGASRRSG